MIIQFLIINFAGILRATLLIFLIAFGIFLLILSIILAKTLPLPENSPGNYLKSIKNRTKSKDESINKETKRKIFVCVGDSITHGKVGVNYVNILKDLINNDEMVYINAGINSEFAYNVLQRIDEIIECEPDFVSILIGTNDANYSFKKQKKYTLNKYLMHLPERPSLEFYKKNLIKIIEKLKEKTHAKIAILSLPTIGEDLNHPIQDHVREFCSVIKSIAKEYGLVYLPLSKQMEDNLKQEEAKNGHKLPYYEHEFRLMAKSLIRRYILNQDYEKISRKYGFLYHVDNLHLNKRGASLIAENLYNFYKAQNTNDSGN
ncbi:MAG: SGNH/GDSL hydrolase family protein [Promethearchaeota archaeon]